jgi:hypothetical protein
MQAWFHERINNGLAGENRITRGEFFFKIGALDERPYAVFMDDGGTTSGKVWVW